MAAQEGYRRDIDGLRAVAIIPVVFYHLGLRYACGGFIGVDIFFVISGYLITQHVIGEIEAGAFSLAMFYERRIRRILPALTVMLAGSAVLAYWLLLPAEMIDFANTLLAALLSVSNIYFWQSASYFEISDKPLLHTWSLGIEEQFYLVLPLMLLLLHRYWPRKLRPTVTIVAVMSFLLSALTVLKFPEATFYLLPQRAWELLVGGMLALGIAPKLRGKVVCETAAGASLIAIVAATMLMTNSMPFPGPLALIPCLAAALTIQAGKEQTTLASRFLSTGPMVAIGRISYSLYLWHLPVIVFLRHAPWIRLGGLSSRLFPFLSYPQCITVDRYALALCLSFLLGFMSWKFVELPARFGRLRPTRKVLLTASGAAVVTLMLCGIAILGDRGIPERFAPEVLKVASYEEPRSHYREGSCFVGNIRTYDASDCLRRDRERPNWLILGDSHAAQLYFGLSQTFPEIHFLQWTIHGCKPVPVFHYGENVDCFHAVNAFYGSYLAKSRLDGIVLAANWQNYDIPRLTAALAVLKQDSQHVVLIGPIMHYDQPLALLLAKEAETGDHSIAKQHRDISYDALDQKMAALAREDWGVPYFSYERAFCSGRDCRVWTEKDVPLQFDDSHLLDGGSILTAQSIRGTGLISNCSSAEARCD